MSLRAKIDDPCQPVVFYEIIPPRLDVPGEMEDRLELVREVAAQADAINIPEIREEKRNGPRRSPLPRRVEPRAFAAAIASAARVETVVNRVTVHEPPAEQRRWLCETYRKWGVRNLILVGGESQQERYAGPSVVEAASLAAEESLPYLLGGITIPHRPQEASRVREKARHGLRFFTTQVLLDSRDILQLLRELEGLRGRVLLSFTPVSHPRDLLFLEWLGVELPPRFAQEIRNGRGAQQAEELSFSLARRILSEVFEHLPANGPAVGIQVERITRRNSAAARRMLTELREFYCQLLRAKVSAGTGKTRSHSKPRPDLAGRRETHG